MNRDIGFHRRGFFPAEEDVGFEQRAGSRSPLRVLASEDVDFGDMRMGRSERSVGSVRGFCLLLL